MVVMEYWAYKSIRLRVKDCGGFFFYIYFSFLKGKHGVCIVAYVYYSRTLKKGYDGRLPIQAIHVSSPLHVQLLIKE